MFELCCSITSNYERGIILTSEQAHRVGKLPKLDLLVQTLRMPERDHS